MLLDILAGAQTSGGLLISLSEDRASALLDDLKAGGAPDAAIIDRAAAPGVELIELGQTCKTVITENPCMEPNTYELTAQG